MGEAELGRRWDPTASGSSKARTRVPSCQRNWDKPCWQQMKSSHGKGGHLQESGLVFYRQGHILQASAVSAPSRVRAAEMLEARDSRSPHLPPADTGTLRILQYFCHQNTCADAK